MKKKKFKIVPAAYLVLAKKKKVLMLRRFNTGYEDGNYSLVAGHLEGNESFRKCLVREAKEEANIILNENDLEIVHVMHRRTTFHDAGLRERIDIFIAAKKWKGEIKNVEPHKCDDLSWFPLKKIPKNTIPYIKLVLKNISKGVFYSEFGF